MDLFQIQANSYYMYQLVLHENNDNHASVQDDLNFYRYPTCYFISENYFYLQPSPGSVDF